VRICGLEEASSGNTARLRLGLARLGAASPAGVPQPRDGIVTHQKQRQGVWLPLSGGTSTQSIEAGARFFLAAAAERAPSPEIARFFLAAAACDRALALAGACHEQRWDARALVRDGEKARAAVPVQGGEERGRCEWTGGRRQLYGSAVRVRAPISFDPTGHVVLVLGILVEVVGPDKGNMDEHNRQMWSALQVFCSILKFNAKSSRFLLDLMKF
jgi:hypothetical protein